jgi:hypothetical protein
LNKRTEILETAKHLVNGDRQNDYGDAAESFQCIAEMWSAYLGVAVSGRDVCNMMALLKIARLRNGPHEDSSVDGAGYLALGAEIGQC